MLAFKYGPSQILNMDETLLCVIGDRVRMVRFTSTTARAAGDLKKSRLNTVGSFTPVVNALGETLLRVYCMKAPKSHNGVLDLPIDKDGKELTVPPTTLPSLSEVFSAGVVTNLETRSGSSRRQVS